MHAQRQLDFEQATRLHSQSFVPPPKPKKNKNHNHHNNTSEFNNLEKSTNAKPLLKRASKKNKKVVDSEISLEDYKNLKSSRGKVVDSFVLEHKKPPEEEPNNTHNPYTEDKVLREEADYEYCDVTQKETILENLINAKHSIISTIIALFFISIPATILLLAENKVTGMLLFEKEIPYNIFAYANVGLLVLAVIFGRNIFSNAISSMIEQKPDRDVLYSLVFFVVLTSAIIFSIKPNELSTIGINLYTPLYIYSLIANFISKNLTLKKVIHDFEFITTTQQLYAVKDVLDRKLVRNMTAGIRVDGDPMVLKNSKIDFLDGYLKSSFGDDLCDRILKKMEICFIPITLFVFTCCYLISQNMYVAISMVSGAAVSVIGFISVFMVNLPINGAMRVVNHYAGMTPNYDSILTFKETDAILIEARDLFSPNTISISTVKTFKDERFDNVMVDCIHILNYVDSVLKYSFSTIVDASEYPDRTVEDVKYEDGMGLSAWVDNRRILMGNRELMKHHSMAVLKPQMEEKYKTGPGQEIIYISCDGQLSAAIVVEFLSSQHSDNIIDLLYKNDVVVIIKTVDACITRKVLEEVFDIDPILFRILPSQLHSDYDACHQHTKRVAGAMVNRGSNFAFAMLIATCKRLYTAMQVGTALYLLSTVGAIMMLVLSVAINKPELAQNNYIGIYMLTCLIAYWGYQKNMNL